jgi:conjugal transfer pilus assembly protein TraF
MKSKLLLYHFILLLQFHTLLANSLHCNTLSGWYFYCDSKEAKKEESETQVEDNNDEFYEAKLKEVQRNLEIKKAKMIINPSEENVKEYIIYQNMVTNMASNVTDMWQRVVWQNPSLDYTVNKPVSKIGKEAYLDERKKQKRQTLEAVSKKYGLFFAFRSDCAFCHRFSPVVKMLEERGFNVVLISMDGGYLPDFSKKQTKMNNGEFAKLGISIDVVPALFLFDGTNSKIIPIGFGFMAFDEVEERIFMLTKQVGEDYN